MGIHGISPVRTLTGAVANKIEKTGQGLRRLANTPQNKSEPVDFRTGAIETFINEMDLLQSRMLSPSEDTLQSIDTLA